MFFVRNRRLFFILTGILILGSFLAVIVFPPEISIEFTGGSLVEVTYQDESGAPVAPPSQEEVQERLEILELGVPSLRESGETGYLLRTRTLSPQEHEEVLSALSLDGTAPLTELRFNSIGPSLGSELTIKAIYAVATVALAIMLYIAWVFRRVSRPVPSWGYGLTAVFMLAIDIIVPTGFYAIYAHFTGAQIDSLFIIALLALLGYCVNDVIVIFDRVREHLAFNDRNAIEEPFDETIGTAITETLGRSINTGLTVVLALLSLVILGNEATRNFALVMIVGVAAGTFSSIARSAPLLIPIAEWIENRRSKEPAESPAATK